MKIGAAVPVYNREQFIGPYLEMLLEFGVEPVVALGTTQWSSQSSSESFDTDRTELILNKFFPEVKVIKQFFAHHADSINIPIQHLKHCDLVMVTDCDMFITKSDWDEFVKWVESEWTRNEVFSVNFERMIKEYYFDWRYGKAALPGGDPPLLAMRPNCEFKHMTEANSHLEVVWDEDGPIWHHMRFCKPNGSGKRKCNEPTSENSNMNDYSPAPAEISDRLNKWKKILADL